MTCRHLVGYLAPAALALCAILLSGCGQKGPLVLQQDKPQSSTLQTAAPRTNTQP